MSFRRGPDNKRINSRSPYPLLDPCGRALNDPSAERACKQRLYSARSSVICNTNEFSKRSESSSAHYLHDRGLSAGVIVLWENREGERLSTSIGEREKSSFRAEKNKNIIITVYIEISYSDFLRRLTIFF